MADLVLRQLVAVIDKRTTPICLHAAGMIRAMNESFDTLLGPQDDPPFHIHCRSMSVPWMPGFVNSIRVDANAELRTRPLAQRRISKEGFEGPLPPRATVEGVVVKPTPVPTTLTRVAEAQADGGPMGMDVLDGKIRDLAKKNAVAVNDRVEGAFPAFKADLARILDDADTDIRAAFPDEADRERFRKALGIRGQGDLIAEVDLLNASAVDIENVREMAEYVVNEGKVIVAVSDDVADLMVSTGRYKTQFETGFSRGTFSPDHRAMTETAMLSVHPSVNAAARPAYGYVSTTGDVISEGVSSYGEIRLELKASVRDRTTVTLGDSLGKAPRPLSLDSVVSSEDAWAARGKDEVWDMTADATLPVDKRAAAVERRSYHEAQIRKGFSLDDVAVAHVPSTSKYDAVAQQLKDNGVRVKRY